jgi:chemotaxis protein methyltransferase CheR
MSEVSLQIIADLLTAHTGQQLSESRRWRVDTALGAIYRKYRIGCSDQLVCLLASPGHDGLANEVVEALLNNETYFFRDHLLFDQLSKTVLPDLAAKRANTRRLSIWSAGCSTGQEALSLSILFAERRDLWDGWSIDILATDISNQAIAAARRACYNQFEIQRGLGVVQMLKHFRETPRGWEPDSKLHERIRFRVANILEPPPRREGFDLVLCRNLLLYFDEITKARAFEQIGHSLRPDGWLMLGAGETVIGKTDRFHPATDVQGLFRHGSARTAGSAPSIRVAATAR